jgi:DNA ligase-1
MEIKPMLAHKYNPDKIQYPAYIQPKLDGVRCVFTKDGAFSRTGKQFKNVRHIESALYSLFVTYPKLILDGELYNHELKHDFEKIISLVKKTKPTDEHRTEAANLVQYHIYDVASMSGISYQGRMMFISSLRNIQNINSKKCIQFIDTQAVIDETDARDMHQEFLNMGYEGSILRNMKGVYKNTRSYDLMKFKDFDDAEATIIGYEMGKGKRHGTLGKFIMQDDAGVQFGCPPGKGYNYKDLADMADNISDYIGQRATFTYFQRTQAGSYRHPHYKCIRNYE